MTQAAVSRIERGVVSPSFGTLQQLMRAMGREPVLSSSRLAGEWDPAHLRSTCERTPEERLKLAIGWNRMAARVALAGEKARRDA